MSTASVAGEGRVLPLATREVVQGMCAGLLRRFHTWLRRAVLDVPHLAHAVPALKQAARLYQAAQYEECLSQVMAVGRTLEEARAAHPTLPPL